MSEKKVALEALYIGTQKAYSAGDDVDAEAVKRWGWEDLTSGANTKAAKDVRGDNESKVAGDGSKLVGQEGSN